MAKLDSNFARWIVLLFQVKNIRMEEQMTFVPHIFLKNMKVEVNFGQQQYPWHSPPAGQGSERKHFGNGKQKGISGRKDILFRNKNGT